MLFLELHRENLHVQGMSLVKGQAPRAPQCDLRCGSSCLGRLRGREAGLRLAQRTRPATRAVPHASPGGELLTELAGWGGLLSTLHPFFALAVQGAHT